uniref:Rad51 recombinase D n=2 Tax=Drosophila melanogaster TaxID=7227 RepID=A1Z7R8_DROME|nr:Rad51 recombinase D [Drosophila melanogaster]AAF58973.2 Rad51 recombinase D [Drosophila melanogaster]|eukprot:NP_610466.2 Rad51 recombinase D [Drosophila melanogaster]
MDLRPMILQTCTGRLLSEYQLNLLRKNNICSLIDFYDADEKKLHELWAINIQSVRELKKELSLLPKGSVDEGTPDFNYDTGIEELDKLLDSVEQPFKPGRVWELCGQPGVGKTQLLYTLALNFVWKHSQAVLFIDTKREFSCKRIQDMLRAREVDEEASERAMKGIRVVQAATGADINDLLKSFDHQLTAETHASMQTKLVLIDSLAACFAFYRGRRMRDVRKSVLTELACKIRKLALRGVAFVIGNVSFFENNKDSCGDDGEQNGDDEEVTRQQLEPMLGSYWSSVATLRLSVELPEEEDFTLQDDGLRFIYVISNTYGPDGEHCLLRITDAGVV